MRSQIRISVAVLFALLTALALFAPGAMADENDNGCKDPTQIAGTSNVVEAEVTTSGNESTYIFRSADRGGDKGVPGLISYCVFPGSQPNSVTVDETPGTGAQGWDLTFFNDPPSFSSFSFNRDTGNESNIPLDGTTRTMGTALWSGGAPAAADQAVTLHINDLAECNRLGENSETCWVLPGTIGEEPPAADLEASKTAEPSFEREFEWEVEKEAEPTEVKVAEGEKAHVTYTIRLIRSEGLDSGWLVTGTITVNNPNEGDVTEVDVTDAINDNGANCTVTGGEEATIPGEGFEEFSYQCEYEGAPEGSPETNTATITWPAQEVAGHPLEAGETTAEAEVDWEEGAEVTLIDDCVEATDTLDGVPTQLAEELCESETYEFEEEFEDPAGTCTEHENTASFLTDDEGREGDASATVKVCVGADLEVSKTASPSFERKFPWKVTKSVDKEKVLTDDGATFNYTIEYLKGEGEDSGWLVKGKITVANPNDFEAIEANLSDAIDDSNATCTLDEETVTVPAGESVEVGYECTYSAKFEDSEQTNTAKATWDAEEAGTPNGSAEGNAEVNWGSPTKELDNCIEATDTLDGTTEVLDAELCESHTYEFEEEFEDPAGTCTEHTNTAAFVTDTTGDEGEDSKTVEVCVGKDLEVSKTASPSFTRKFSWSVKKNVDKTKVVTSGSTATFKYTIEYVKGEGEDSGWLVKGKITVANPNDFEAIEANLSDAIDDSNATCTLDEETVTVPAGESVEVGYECTYSAKFEDSEQTNTAKATWDAEEAGTPNGSAEGTAEVNWGSPSEELDECVETKDTVDGVSTPLDEELCESKTYEPELSFPVEPGCAKHTNTAAFKTNDSGTEGSASKEVEVCGPLHTGALTMGFWHNKNGQKIITGDKEVSKVCKLTTWLRELNPFKDLSATASCKEVAAYQLKIFEAANAGGSSMNPMLKSQMLATALNVYFSDPKLGGNQIKAPKPIGGVTIDITKWSAAFGGAKSMTVMEMLNYAAGKSDSGGKNWYGQNKTTQGLAKDAFDAINNDQVFGP